MGEEKLKGLCQVCFKSGVDVKVEEGITQCVAFCGDNK